MEEKQQTNKPVKIRGYLYVLVQNFTLSETEKQVSCILSLGTNASCETKAYASGTPVNEVFLIEVPEDPTRLVAEFKQDGTSLGQCRYDVNPFFAHPAAPHTMSSDIVNINQEKKGSVNMKITYYSAEYGKLRIRVFHLSMVEPVIEHYKQARLKVKIGIFAQSSALWDMKANFDETLQLLILTKNANLQFDVVHDEGILAKYTIYDLQKSNLMINQTKAYQVSLFNKDKAVGTIKYQIDWIHQ